LWDGLHDDTVLDRLPGDQRERGERARRNLDRWRSLKGRLPIARLLGEVFADSGYDGAMQFESLGDRKLANLWKLVDLARTFDRSGLFGLAEFIARLSDLVKNQPREEQAATQPENADVIRLMTIHQAKASNFRSSSSPTWMPGSGVLKCPSPFGMAGSAASPARREMRNRRPSSIMPGNCGACVRKSRTGRNSLRTLYVACTRAQHYLILSAGLTPALQPSSPWMQTLAGRFDLRCGECLVADIPAEKMPRVRVLGSAVGIEEEVGPLPPAEKIVAVPGKGWPGLYRCAQTGRFSTRWKSWRPGSPGIRARHGPPVHLSCSMTPRML